MLQLRQQNVIRFNPPPTTAETFDYAYRRRERVLRTLGYTTGTVTTNGTAVTGTSTVFNTAYHPGCVIRFGDTTSVPTGLEGLYPWVEERTIVSVGSTTALVIDSALSSELTGK